jgi:polyisoprenyl-phosphate glycosyltransferase
MSCLSIAIPVFNEEENVPQLAARLKTAIAALEFDDYEIIFVDDGSRDASPQILTSLHDSDPHIRVIRFSRNFGHQAALQAGMDECRGDALVFMDADLQDPPEVIADFVAQWRAGYEIVYAIRKKRKEGLIKRAAYRAFYRSLQVVANIDVPLDAGDFCLMDRRVVDALTALPERNRFLRGLRSWVGFTQVGVEYERQARLAGTPKYTLRKLMGLALSGYIGFSAMPLRVASALGGLSALAGVGLIAWAVLEKLTGHPTPWGWASTVSIMLFMGGMQLGVLGVIGEYLSRTYDEVRRRPLYIISRQLDRRTVSMQDVAQVLVATKRQNRSWGDGK